MSVDLIVDDHRLQQSNEVLWFCRQVVITLKILEIGTPWENRAELYIGLLKKALRRDMKI